MSGSSSARIQRTRADDHQLGVEDVADAFQRGPLAGLGASAQPVAGLDDEGADRGRGLGLGDGRIVVAERGEQRRAIGLGARDRVGSLAHVSSLVGSRRSSVESRLEASSQQVRAVGLGDPADPPSPSGHVSATRCAAGSAARAYSSRTRRGTARTASVPARRQHRFVEPVGIDRVVDVVHRVELLRSDRELGAAGAAGTSPRSTRAKPNVAGGVPKMASNSAGMRVGVPRSSSRTQSIWTHDTTEPAASWNSVLRRAQTRRPPTTGWCRPARSRPRSGQRQRPRPRGPAR